MGLYRLSFLLDMLESWLSLLTLFFFYGNWRGYLACARSK